MPEDPKNDAAEPEDPKVLPQREMMSLISTDPVSPDPIIYTTPGGPVDAPPMTAEGPPMAGLPVEPITEGETDSEANSETISQTDEASAG